ncbi:MAG: hypothetical protein V4510_12430, partial [bacterium]
MNANPLVLMAEAARGFGAVDAALLVARHDGNADAAMVEGYNPQWIDRLITGIRGNRSDRAPWTFDDVRLFIEGGIRHLGESLDAG